MPKKGGGNNPYLSGMPPAMQAMMQMMMGQQMQQMNSQMNTMPMMMKGGGRGRGQMPKKDKVPRGEPHELSWKEKLHNMLVKSPQGLGEDKIVYAAEANGVPEASEEKTNFVGSVTVHGVTYSTEEPVTGKRAAEQAAAKAAIKELFPAEFKTLEVEAEKAAAAVAAAGSKASKDPADKAERPERPKKPPSDHPKNQLQHGLMVFLNRSLTKGELPYTTETFESNGATTYQTTVTLVPYDNKSFSGEIKESKAEAEKSAAAVAYAELQEVFAPLEEAHQVKRKLELEERAEARKKRREEEAAAAEGATN